MNFLSTIVVACEFAEVVGNMNFSTLILRLFNEVRKQRRAKLWIRSNAVLWKCRIDFEQVLRHGPILSISARSSCLPFSSKFFLFTLYFFTFTFTFLLFKLESLQLFAICSADVIDCKHLACFRQVSQFVLESEKRLCKLGRVEHEVLFAVGGAAVTCAVYKDERSLTSLSLFLSSYPYLAYYLVERLINFFVTCIDELDDVILRDVHHWYKWIHIDKIILHVRNVLMLVLL